jgi:hypothetical protein
MKTRVSDDNVASAANNCVPHDARHELGDKYKSSDSSRAQAVIARANAVASAPPRTQPMTRRRKRDAPMASNSDSMALLSTMRAERASRQCNSSSRNDGVLVNTLVSASTPTVSIGLLIKQRTSSFESLLIAVSMTSMCLLCISQPARNLRQLVRLTDVSPSSSTPRK